MKIGEMIKIARKDRGLTQKELAEKSGVAEISVRNYENDKRQPKVEQLEKISYALGVRLEYFIQGGTPSPKLTLINYLESLGYKLSFYEEESWRAFRLCDINADESFSINFEEFEQLQKTISSYSVFAVKQLIDKVKEEQMKEHEANSKDNWEQP